VIGFAHAVGGAREPSCIATVPLGFAASLGSAIGQILAG